VIVHRYPAKVKAFYMKRDPENAEVALAMDVLAPEGYGEIIGGSQREDDYEVLSAGSGKEALETLQNVPVDLILLDVNMPEMDGLETLRRIKERDEEADIIMVSALNLARKAVDAMKLGAYDYITKPFDFGKVRLSIQKALEASQLKREVRHLRREQSITFIKAAVLSIP
jgi:DNA-binding NtrC family response regulator